MEFFEVISFFGIAAFFAWLGFAPLQGQLFTSLPEGKREKAKQNLFLITEYFLMSFVLFSICAIADYASHRPTFTFGQEGLIKISVLATFVLGMLGLFVPILYIRIMGKVGKDLGDITPPPPDRVLFATFLVFWSTLLWLSFFIGASTDWGRALWIVSGVVSSIGALRSISRKADDAKVFADFAIAFIPFWLLLLSAWIPSILRM